MSLPEVLGFIYGLVIGISLGLTGGGGSIFAVPLLVYGLHLAPRNAVGLSLAAVGITAGFGAALRIKAREIEFVPGIVFALGGMLFAPLGTWCGQLVPEAVLLTLFAVIMCVIGWRMWTASARCESRAEAVNSLLEQNRQTGFYLRLSGAGALVGLMSGLFGIGGGFLIVPALLQFTGTSIHRAAATSLLVIFLVSISGVAAHLLHGQNFPMPVSALFIAGGFAGMFWGSAWRCRLSAEGLRKTFALAIGVVAILIFCKEGGVLG